MQIIKFFIYYKFTFIYAKTNNLYLLSNYDLVKITFFPDNDFKEKVWLFDYISNITELMILNFIHYEEF